MKKVVDRFWESDGKEARLIVTFDDGSVFSCNNEFKDWQRREPSDEELADIFNREYANAN